MKKHRITGGLLSLLLALVLVAPAVVSADSDQGKGPPDLDRIVFIHSRNHDAKPTDGKPSKTPALYSYSRYRWPTAAIPYYYNDANSPVANALEGIQAAFGAWNDTDSSVVFSYQTTTSALPGVDVSFPDYQNVVGWAVLDPGTIGLTIIWSNSRTKVVVDVDTVLNLHSSYAWSQTVVVDAPDLLQLTDTDAYDVDVQAIMTHEAGHWLVLNDLYTSSAGDQTMYGYASDRELKKRSLESGDIAGVIKIYP